LKWVSETKNIRIRHKLNGGEVKIGRFKVDGLEEATKKVFEFNGCWWHGCPTCMKNRYEMTFDSGRTAEEAYQATLDRQKFLEDDGFKVETKWECLLKKELCFSLFIIAFLLLYADFRKTGKWPHFSTR